MLPLVEIPVATRARSGCSVQPQLSPNRDHHPLCGKYDRFGKKGRDVDVVPVSIAAALDRRVALEKAHEDPDRGLIRIPFYEVEV